MFCLIDAIFSIGVRYSATQNTVENYCKLYGYDKIDATRCNPIDRHTIKELIKTIEPYLSSGYGEKELFNNTQRTSSRNGILKAQAVYEAAVLLNRLGINTKKDIRNINQLKEKEIENAFKKIKGQSSGISFSYFMMLSGDENKMKIDRWLLRFVTKATGKKNHQINEVLEDLMMVFKELKNTRFPYLTPRLLDYKIWKYEKTCNK